ncbi:MAG: 5-formyltetrahydrofolate cyclo-ligase [Eubacterium sp.]|nr:5-formyltetrahydrofolate cyclo-ligase [Eubacterium sp.]
MDKKERKILRKIKVQARDRFSTEERELLSKKIVDQILASNEFQQARMIMIYKGFRGEVRLEALEEAVKAQNLLLENQQLLKKQEIETIRKKQLIYPLCISNSEMIALLPEDESAWKSGYFGIQEPIRERSQEIAPEDIDLVICPCTVFDEQGGRMGMGAGFYDRYLEKCTKAIVAAVSFECQKTDVIPMEPWDKPMDLIYTEAATYRVKELCI